MSDACGLPIVEMPDEVTPLCALVILKALDVDGEVTYLVRSTEDVSVVEALGMVAYADIKLREAFTDDD